MEGKALGAFAVATVGECEGVKMEGRSLGDAAFSRVGDFIAKGTRPEGRIPEKSRISNGLPFDIAVIP